MAQTQLEDVRMYPERHSGTLTAADGQPIRRLRRQSQAWKDSPRTPVRRSSRAGMVYNDFPRAPARRSSRAGIVYNDISWGPARRSSRAGTVHNDFHGAPVQENSRAGIAYNDVSWGPARRNSRAGTALNDVHGASARRNSRAAMSYPSRGTTQGEPKEAASSSFMSVLRRRGKEVSRATRCIEISSPIMTGHTAAPAGQWSGQAMGTHRKESVETHEEMDENGDSESDFWG